MRFDSQLSRMNCQMFSMEFNSGALGGNGSSVMLAGMSSLVSRVPSGAVENEDGMGVWLHL